MVRGTQSITHAFQATSASPFNNNTTLSSADQAQPLLLSPLSCSTLLPIDSSRIRPSSQGVIELESEYNSESQVDSELSPTDIGYDSLPVSSIPGTPTPVTRSSQRGSYFNSMSTLAFSSN